MHARAQELAVLLRRLKAGGHKALIFTQMARMLDILEARSLPCALILPGKHAPSHALHSLLLPA